MGSATQMRQDAIKTLVAHESINDQKQLVEKLQTQYGIETNQAVVSRDLRKLGIVKKQIKGTLIYELPHTDAGTEILKLALEDIQFNEVMIVINTYPGVAPFVGDSIDQTPSLGVLGCIAGENVVFVTPKSVKDLPAVYEALCKHFHFKPSGDKP